MQEFRDTERICWLCKHFLYTQADSGYSEMTPGWNFDIQCNIGKWEFDKFDSTQADFARCLQAARTCDDFELDKQVLMEINKSGKTRKRR